MRPRAGLAILSLAAGLTAAPVERSGIHPELAYFNDEGECGTGAVVPWADRLWVITYGPHLPFGSSDKLYEITPDLRQIVRPESVGGTPANRMIHKESNQLIIGPYFIGADREVRVIPPKLMPGRLTGNARHLTAPADKVYFATMEDGLYEVDVRTLAVKGLIREIMNKPKPGQTTETDPATITSTLPGYHGKGLYSGQGLVILANNGERSKEALTDPAVVSGALGSWNGEGNWSLVRRNQFTEVTGPGGLAGNADSAKDPVWSIGWDQRSLILMVMEDGKWTSYRLPKGSHTYDGAHGWNTEWPRIRDIGEDGSRLMTMHGLFWRFPAGFSSKKSAGIAPRSAYLKVIGDFTRWNDRLVFGCDDTAKSEFLNKRPAKGALAGPGQSQSNLWFTSPETPDKLGPALGRGSVWVDEPVKAGVPSDPFLLAGFAKRATFLAHDGTAATTFSLEIDAQGDGQWKSWRDVVLKAGDASAWVEIPAALPGAWIRTKTDRDVAKASVTFQYAAKDERLTERDAIFKGLSKAGDTTSQGAFLLTRGANLRTLSVLTATVTPDRTTPGDAYVLSADLKLTKMADPKVAADVEKSTPIPQGIITADEASVIFEEGGVRWRLPRAFAEGDPRNAAFDALLTRSALRKAREVCTERDLLQAHGTFYELPALNAKGAIRMRPVATSNAAVHDYCSYRGLLVLSGIDPAAGSGNHHVIRSDDGKAAVWAGAADDLWQLGKPRGFGGPWKRTAVQKGAPSDPYLMTGYDRKTLTLENHGPEPARVTVELDVAGDGRFAVYQDFTVAPGESLEHRLPGWLNAYWLRTVSAQTTRLSAQLAYD
ncbi:MAG: hypothetical protein FJ410_01270 [Verrucomicrobia bacterium]|nr:hypothetical protein [Verrucomicrobiota bacterium]